MRCPRSRRCGVLGLALAGAAGASLVSGCVTSGRLLDARGTGIARCYLLPFDELWPRVQESVRWIGLVIDNANADAGFILARNYEPEVRDPDDMALDADQGERVAVFVEPEGTRVWAVEVVSRRAFVLDPTPRDWTVPLFEALEARLPESATRPDDELAACTRVRGLTEPDGTP